MLLDTVEHYDIDTGRAQSMCRAVTNTVRGCRHYHGPTACEVATVWLCTMGGDEANVGLVGEPWTWPDHWVTYGPPTGEML